MMNHLNSRRAFDESHRSFSLAKQPTTYQVHDLCSKFAQMMADDSQDKVAVALSAAGINVVREPKTWR
jgi:hypothetical protein